MYLRMANCVSTRLCTVAGLCVGMFLSGCSKSYEPPRLPVAAIQGTVTFDGKPTPGAFVVLHPQGEVASEAPRPSAVVREDGSFELSTFDHRDGAPPGEYKVTVEWRPLVGEGGDAEPGPNVLPEQYTKARTSPLAVRVASNDNEVLSLKLSR